MLLYSQVKPVELRGFEPVANPQDMASELPKHTAGIHFEDTKSQNTTCGNTTLLVKDK